MILKDGYKKLETVDSMMDQTNNSYKNNDQNFTKAL